MDEQDPTPFVVLPYSMSDDAKNNVLRSLATAGFGVTLRGALEPHGPTYNLDTHDEDDRLYKEDVEPGEVYVSRGQSPDYRDRFSIVRVLEVPDDDHPDVIAETLFSNHDDTPSGGETSVSPRMFEEQLHEVRALPDP